ncbi:predicted protein [Naegleria gruberi]|uniref:Predicted protein n=1 Tax=Naegleria gruberi TaxID=5762 RepID=D2VYN1_NAEGR|nr:uncharacterized protein NAEGRDRAFT_74179 [Naegleria gruberi]EFC38144.1 predicted protein [Naegleria gruberi]|eukprot:XP_002670888.1 predicted protein [Naegleria gruberi strain NEG-M]
MKKLQKLILEIPIETTILEEIEKDPNFLVDFFRNVSSNCQELFLRFEGTAIVNQLQLDYISNLSRLEINQLPNPLLLNPSLRELKIGTYSTVPPISCQFLNKDFLMGNKFDHLKRLELLRVRNLEGASNSFPSLEFVKCFCCFFNSGIDFFTRIRKLKSLILDKCDFKLQSNVEFQCKELEELNITTARSIHFLDISLLSGLQLRKLTIYPGENDDLSPIEQMISLEYLSILSSYQNISLKKLTNLKYLGFSYAEISSSSSSTNLIEEYLLHNCVIHISRIYNATGNLIPVLSETGSETIHQSITEQICQNKNQFEGGLNNVKFILLSNEKIYVSFYILASHQPDQPYMTYCYPSYILFERTPPFSILSSGRHSEMKQTFKNENVNSNDKEIITTKKTSKCEIQ